MDNIDRFGIVPETQHRPDLLDFQRDLLGITNVVQRSFQHCWLDNVVQRSFQHCWLDNVVQRSFQHCWLDNVVQRSFQHCWLEKWPFLHRNLTDSLGLRAVAMEFIAQSTDIKIFDSLDQE